MFRRSHRSRNPHLTASVKSTWLCRLHCRDSRGGRRVLRGLYIDVENFARGALERIRIRRTVRGSNTEASETSSPDTKPGNTNDSCDAKGANHGRSPPSRSRAELAITFDVWSRPDSPKESDLAMLVIDVWRGPRPGTVALPAGSAQGLTTRWAIATARANPSPHCSRATRRSRATGAPARFGVQTTV